MKCLIVYFSQTNSTKIIAESIGSAIKDLSWDVELINIKYDKIENIKEYDLIGFGTPVYYYRLPFLVEDYLKSLPDLKNKPVFSFITYGTYYFDVPIKIDNILNDKNTITLGFFSARGADKYLGYLQQGVLFSNNHPNKQEIGEAKTFAKSIIENFTDKTELDKKLVNNKKNIVYNFESLFTNRLLINNIYSKLFSVNKNCLGCGKCVKKCPQDNISLDNKKTPQWGKNCELCFLCEIVCPVQAINSVVDMKIFQPILNYNVKNGLKDDNIDHIRIEYKDGEIIE